MDKIGFQGLETEKERVLRTRKEEDELEKKITNDFARSKIKQILENSYPITSFSMLTVPVHSGLKIEIRLVYQISK